MEAIAQIERYADRGQDAFNQSELIQIWIVHHLQIVGEAAKSTSATLIEQYPDVPWSDARDLRNVLVHEYFRVNTDIIWDIVEQDLPELKRKVEEILRELEEN